MSTAVATKEKTVFIKRKITFMESAQANDNSVKEYQDMAYRAIGSYFEDFGRIYGSGLTRAEKAFLMPELTGYDPAVDRREFNKSVQEYFKNINTKVPAEGLRLNIALEDPTRPLLSKGEDGKVIENFPVNIKDYVAYRHALGHREVGESFEEANMYDHIKFYIEDEDKVIKEATGLNEKEDKARLAYYQLIEKEDRVNQMLTLLGVSIKNMSFNEKKLLLKDYASIDSKRSKASNEERLDVFIRLSEDRDLEVKYKIEELIRVGALERVGNRIVMSESGTEIGIDLRAATLWYKDPSNSRDVNVLTARYNEFNRKSKVELPQELSETPEIPETPEAPGDPVKTQEEEESKSNPEEPKDESGPTT